MQPDPQLIPTPVPKSDRPSLRKPLRLALLRAAGIALRLLSPRPAGARLEAARTAAEALTALQSPSPRILLIRPDHLGDILFMTPALRVLRAQLPAAHLTALVGPWAKSALAHNPRLDDIQMLDFPGFTRSAKASPLAPYRLLWIAARRLRAQRFDTAVILRFDHWWGALLAALAGIPRRIGYDVPEVRPFINEVVPYELGRHEVLQNVRLVCRAARAAEPALSSPADLPLEFHPAPDAEAFAEPWLRSKGIIAGARPAPFGVGGESAGLSPQGRIPTDRAEGPASPPAAALERKGIVDPPRVLGGGSTAAHNTEGVVPARERFALLVPGSGALVKLWREDGFARVAEALYARGLKVIIVGAGEAERALAERIASQTRVPLINVAGETSFEQLAALFGRAALAVGTDSGPMHLAVAMRTPSVHLFGPVSAQTFGPWGDPVDRLTAFTLWPLRGEAAFGDAKGHSRGRGDAGLGGGPARHIVLTSGLACIACNRLDYDASELPAHPCVRLIADRQVFAAVEALSSVL